MALKPCSHCGEEIEENATVCPRCYTFGPFESSLPGAPIDAFPDLSEERDARGGEEREGCLKGLFKELGCHCAIYLGGFIILAVLVIILTLLAAVCGVGAPP